MKRRAFLASIPGVSLAAASGTRIKAPAGPPLDQVVTLRMGECAGGVTQWAVWEDTEVQAGTWLNPFVPLFKNVSGPLLLWNAELKFYPQTHSKDIARFLSCCSVFCDGARVPPAGLGVGFSRGPVDDPRNETGYPVNRWVALSVDRRLDVQICGHTPFTPRHDFRFQVSLRMERPTSWRPAGDGSRL